MLTRRELMILVMLLIWLLPGIKINVRKTRRNQDCINCRRLHSHSRKDSGINIINLAKLDKSAKSQTLFQSHLAQIVS